MFKRLQSLLLLPALATVLSAQEPRFGLGLNLVIPAGGFRSTAYGPTTALPYGQEEGYDIGLGAQFTLSFPLDARTAVRLNLSGHSARGTNTAPGFESLTLEHGMFSLGAEMQFFSGSAYRHRGAYLLAGVSADFESFSRGYVDDYTWDQTTRKGRFGGTLGVGRTFGYDSGLRYTMELVYHKTLSGDDRNRQEPPSTDFLRISFGWVF